ncbi:MAG TPA: Uma2 family endonuclease [Myxococcaceae bacterium]|nr:Uma2 family endonuclease [Myxococcaceae bacterium]
MKAFTKKPATYDDIRQLPEGMNGELVDGQLFAWPRPTMGHAHLAGVLLYELHGSFDLGKGVHGRWWIFREPELHFGPNVVIPDLAGWRRERLPKMPDVPFMELAPDWICEITSRSTASFDRVNKLPVYLKAGVAFAWLVDPTSRTIEALQKVKDHWTLIGNFPGDAPARIEPFEAHEFDLSTLWLEDG